MKKSLYSVFFMIFISLIFIIPLAFINEISKEQVQKNERIEQYKSILYAFNIFPKETNEKALDPSGITADISWNEETLIQTYRQNIQEFYIKLTEQERLKAKENPFLSNPDSIVLYGRFNEDTLISIGFYINGKGLWGSIESFCVVKADLKSLQGIDFTKQSETPGLGARILENWFKIHFRNLALTQNNSENIVELSAKKTKNNIESQTNTFEAVTGATLTSRGVLEALNVNLPLYLSIIDNHRDQLLPSAIKE